MEKSHTGDVETTSFMWDIPNFSSYTEVGDYVVSPIFCASDMLKFPDRAKWQVKLYPRGKNDDCKDYLSFELSAFFSGYRRECKIRYEYFIYGGYDYPTTSAELTEANNTTEFLKYKPRESEDVQKNLFMWDGTLKLLCIIREIRNYNTYKVDETVSLIESFDRLFLSDNFSDVLIEVEGKQLKAHKNILAARSEVFHAMLTHDTVEKKENIIKITDFSFDVIKEVMRYIYCGKIDNLDAVNEDLLAAADKYDLKHLKSICERSIWKNMNHDQIWEILYLSDLYNCGELKYKAIDYIAENITEVIKLPGCTDVSNSNPKLIEKVFSEIARFRKLSKDVMENFGLSYFDSECD